MPESRANVTIKRRKLGVLVGLVVNSKPREPFAARMRSSKWTWKNVSLGTKKAEALALDFEADFLEAALDGAECKRPVGEQIELLAHLGDLYTRLGRLDKGLEVDKKLVIICPEEPIFHYNLACSHSRLGEVESAIRSLEEAIRLGYQNFDHLRKDRDLDNLKQDARFLKLLRQLDTSF